MPYRQPPSPSASSQIDGQIPTAAPPDASFIIGTAIEALADIAPTLKGEAELRVLIELLRRQLREGRAVRVSSRELATACRISRTSAQAAIDKLTERLLITARQGTATTAAVYQVNIHQTVKISGPNFGPPNTREVAQILGHPAQNLSQGGLNLGPPPQKTRHLPEPPPRLILTLRF